MVTNEGYRPTKQQRIHYAKQIVTAFPKLKDPGTEEGYVSGFDYTLFVSRPIECRVMELNEFSGNIL